MQLCNSDNQPTAKGQAVNFMQVWKQSSQEQIFQTFGYTKNNS